MKKEMKNIRVISAIILFTLVMIVYCFAENNWVKVEHIKIEISNLPRELSGLKIAHISDVHLPKNASNIDNVVHKAKQQKPDIIVITGDIIDESADLKTCGLDKLCKGLSEITKTYAVTGNHELWNGNVEEWTDILTRNNVEVIDNKIEMYTKDNNSISIAGLMDSTEYIPSDFADIKNAKNMPMILLAHRPELFISSYSSDLNSINPSIVFSGHAHGGQFRIPFINKGIIAPNQGLFPEYTSGLYTNNNVKMIVSRGLGNSIIPIRINNRPHLPVIELVADSENVVQTKSKVKYFKIKDIQLQQEVEQREPDFVSEFLQLLKVQKYSKTHENWNQEYEVQLIGQDEVPVLNISFSGRSLTLDRTFDFEGTTVEKGTYEVEGWISEYLKNFYMGQVINPSKIKLPAIINIKGDVFKRDLIDEGSTKVNLYDVIPQMNDFVYNNVIDNHFEIIDYKVIYSYEAVEAEKELLKSRNKCISLEFSTSENFLDINAGNNYKCFVRASSLIIAKQGQLMYTVITDNMIFNVKASEEFDEQFNELFQLNNLKSHQLIPEEIAALSADRKQNFMEFISKNLGLDSVELRDDYTFESKPFRLENGSLYNILTFSDSYITRLLIFENNDKKSKKYIGNIDIRSRGDKADYKIKRMGDKTFIIAEENYRSHGTGSLTYSQDWYSIDGDNVKTVLSIPKIRHEIYDYGFKLGLKSLDYSDSGEGKLSANYNLSKLYSIKLPISDEHGYVTVTADKQVEFVWDEEEKCFVSKYSFDDLGIDDLISDYQEIKDKCSKILNKYYNQLESNITAASSKSDDTTRAYKAFLDDCIPDKKVDNLKRKLVYNR